MTDLKEYQKFLENSRIPVRLACKTESGWPMILSLWFIYLDGSLYCATRKNARIVAYLLHNEQCAFEIAGDQPPYCGVRGQARATVDQTRGVEILERLLDRYLGDRTSSLAVKLLKNSQDEVAIRLDPINLYSWNFSTRMKDVDTGSGKFNIQVCP